MSVNLNSKLLFARKSYRHSSEPSERSIRPISDLSISAEDCPVIGASPAPEIFRPASPQTGCGQPRRPPFEAVTAQRKAKPAVHGFKAHVGADATSALVEKIFGAGKRSYGLLRRRWRGLAKAAARFISPPSPAISSARDRSSWQPSDHPQPDIARQTLPATSWQNIAKSAPSTPTRAQVS